MATKPIATKDKKSIAKNSPKSKNVKKTKIGLVKNDSWLEPFENAIVGRHQHVLDKLNELTNNGKISLSEFASGHLYFGLHKTEKGWTLREWAPNATEIYVVGDFNGWNEWSHEMTRVEPTTMGVYEIFVPGVQQGALYKFLIHAKDGSKHYKSDPYATYAQMRPETASVVFDVDHFKWTDKAWMAERKKVETEWRAENRELSRKLNQFLSGEIPEIDYHKIEIKPDTATRAASATMLGVYAESVENMIVASADLSNSDKTDGFLKKTKAFTKGDFSGQFFQAGVAELTMTCVMNGMALHGGVIPACGTFFVFSDYMKPAIRMSALMRLKVIYIWSHDSFRVGEDGPTHQPIEHETQIRLMEHLHNHQGERSMVVLRPADAEETAVAWQYAMAEKRPVALILSRQNIKSLPALSCSRREEAKQAVKGAYIVMDAAKADVVMLASGSEVSTLIEGAEMLKKEGVAVRVVSVPSEGLFRDQPKSYQDSVLPQGVVRYGMTSGLSTNLRGLVGDNGVIHGCDHFGYSAPFKVLDEKFGYNGQTVYEEVKALINK